MEPSKYLSILHTAEQLKNQTRHSLTSSGRHESVAEHTFRLCMMAWFCRDEFPDLAMNRVLQMCLFHDIGEAFTGDIPAFRKTDRDETRETDTVGQWIGTLPAPYRQELTGLFLEMQSLQTPESKLPAPPPGCRWNMTCSFAMGSRSAGNFPSPGHCAAWWKRNRGS